MLGKTARPEIYCPREYRLHVCTHSHDIQRSHEKVIQAHLQGGGAVGEIRIEVTEVTEERNSEEEKSDTTDRGSCQIGFVGSGWCDWWEQLGWINRRNWLGCLFDYSEWVVLFAENPTVNTIDVVIDGIRSEQFHTPPTNMHVALRARHMVATPVLLDHDSAFWALLDVAVTLSPTI
jgi:hypothetical protein